MVRRLLLAFLTSVCQYILYGSIFIICMVFIPWPSIALLLIVPYILIPIISASGCCFLMNRNNFYFDSRNMATKASAYRLAVRLLSVFCFLLVGYNLDKKNVVPIFVSDLLNKSGEYAGTFESLLTNLFFYLLVAIFPTVFAFVEYLFVATKNDYSAER